MKENKDPTELDILFKCLSKQPRREVIRVLESMDRGEVEVDELVNRIDPEDKKKFTVQLQQVHLPMLEKAGILNYNFERERVTYRLSVGKGGVELL